MGAGSLQGAAAGDALRQNAEREKRGKLERFVYLNRYAKKGAILFAGSSLTEQFPIGEFLMDFDLPFTIYNRGVGGFTTQDLLQNMDVCIFDLEPARIFLSIGTNDMNDAQFRLEEMLARYGEIVGQIRSRLPDAELTLLAYYPVNSEGGAARKAGPMFRARTNARIDEANRAVQAMADRMHVRYLDLNERLRDSEGNLKREFTAEGVHMYANGYRVVLDALMPVLRQE